MSLRDLRPLLAVALLGVGVALAQTLGGVDVMYLSLVPPLLLFLPLLLGRYVGEERLQRLIAVRRPRPLRAARALAAPRLRPRRRIVPGSLLLAARLAGRAPPRASLAAV